MGKLKDIVNRLRSYQTEKEWFEFKVNWYDPQELGEYISALSNSAAIEGRKEAYFVWGIDNETYEVVGTTFKFDIDVKNDPLKHFLARKISPDMNFTFEEGKVEGCRVVLLTIPAAKTAPTAFDKMRYIRIGSSKERLEKYPEREANLFDVLKHGLPSIVNTTSEYQDLTFEKLLIYYGAKGIKLNEKTFKKNLGLLTKDGQYNILAQLLSDDSHMPIRVAIFSGKTKSDNMYSIREFGYQCLLYSLDDILRYGDILNIIQADEKERVVERKETPLFENDAFREAVINAFVHNRWVSGNEPMFTVYSDRIEILSRGTLVPDQTIDGFFAGESIPVNPKLSEIMLQLHISEKTGRGVPTIVKSYGRKAVEFRENSIVVTLPFNWINVMSDKTGNRVGDKTGDKIGDKNKVNVISNTQARVLSEIRNNPNITIPQVARNQTLAKSTVDKTIAVLKKAGIIERVGSNKTGYWIINEDYL